MLNTLIDACLLYVAREQRDGWYKFEGSYYKFLAQGNTLEEGQEVCETQGGRLASLESQEEYIFVKNIAFTFHYHYPETFQGTYRLGNQTNHYLKTLVCY